MPIAATPEMTNASDPWTVLIVGDGPLVEPLQAAFEAAGHDVETASPGNAVVMVTAAAPDQVLLVGSAAEDGGERIISSLPADDDAPITVVGSHIARSVRGGREVRRLSAELPAVVIARRLTAPDSAGAVRKSRRPPKGHAPEVTIPKQTAPRGSQAPRGFDGPSPASPLSALLTTPRAARQVSITPPPGAGPPRGAWSAPAAKQAASSDAAVGVQADQARHAAVAPQPKPRIKTPTADATGVTAKPKNSESGPDSGIVEAAAPEEPETEVPGQKPRAPQARIAPPPPAASAELPASSCDPETEVPGQKPRAAATVKVVEPPTAHTAGATPPPLRRAATGGQSLPKRSAPRSKTLLGFEAPQQPNLDALEQVRERTLAAAERARAEAVAEAERAIAAADEAKAMAVAAMARAEAEATAVRAKVEAEVQDAIRSMSPPAPQDEHEEDGVDALPPALRAPEAVDENAAEALLNALESGSAAPPAIAGVHDDVTVRTWTSDEVQTEAPGGQATQADSMMEELPTTRMDVPTEFEATIDAAAAAASAAPAPPRQARAAAPTPYVSPAVSLQAYAKAHRGSPSDGLAAVRSRLVDARTWLLATAPQLRVLAVQHRLSLGIAAAVLLLGIAALGIGGRQPDAVASAVSADGPSTAVAEPEVPAAELGATGPEPATEAAALAAEEDAEAEAAALAAEEDAEAEAAALAAEEAAEAEAAEEDAPATGAAPAQPERRNWDDVVRERRIEAARDMVIEAGKLRRRGHLGLAESRYVSALEAWPNYPLAVAGVVRIHLQRRDGREAVRWARKLVGMQPNRGNNQYLMGEAYLLRGQKARAIHAYKKSRRYGNKRARRKLQQLTGRK